MALEHAILVSLAERSASGYELARRFDASIGNFWKASHQQIYKVLGRMETGGQVASELVEQDGRPDKKVYAITTSGRDELSRWVGTPTPAEALRSEFAVKLRALHLADPATLRADVGRRRVQHTEKLAYYEASRQKFYPDPAAVSPEALGGYLVLRGGMLAEQAGLDWCDEILGQLDTVDGAVR
ncbi:transcriptional regulator, PadR family [Aeromicrobium marinum DSM 15272]|uniref:Transcriptional regulator, PadR family n=1 Tax=Aeromicrobium marinum DSM 15272 TaxID=585531 RepID=E2S8I1_9ACTN|nr:PadR family transcriptional regulator [Aeromicrobium marinum]EFQ84486.1 transcriptional regulator, PadR family [Aeromicrobium marinum DSM 15272]